MVRHAAPAGCTANLRVPTIIYQVLTSQLGWLVFSWCRTGVASAPTICEIYLLGRRNPPIPLETRTGIQDRDLLIRTSLINFLKPVNYESLQHPRTRVTKTLERFRCPRTNPSPRLPLMHQLKNQSSNLPSTYCGYGTRSPALFKTTFAKPQDIVSPSSSRSHCPRPTSARASFGSNGSPISTRTRSKT
jgi:hypothetical protein